jgi:hypothetical protein
VAAQDRAHQFRSIRCDGTQARVASQKAKQCISTVGLVQTDPVAPGPEIDRSVEVGRQKLPNDDGSLRGGR